MRLENASERAPTDPTREQIQAFPKSHQHSSELRQHRAAAAAPAPSQTFPMGARGIPASPEEEKHSSGVLGILLGSPAGSHQGRGITHKEKGCPVPRDAGAAGRAERVKGDLGTGLMYLGEFGIH